MLTFQLHVLGHLYQKKAYAYLPAIRYVILNIPIDGFKPGLDGTPIKEGMNEINVNESIAKTNIIPACLNPELNLPFAIKPAIAPFPKACIVTP